MKNMILVLFVVFTGCSFDAYVPDEITMLDDNVFYSVTGENISGDLFYYNGSMLSKEISGEFSYSCRTATPSIVFQSYADDVTITLTYNGVEYSDSGGGTLIITIP